MNLNRLLIDVLLSIYYLSQVIRALITELKIMVNLGGHLNIVNLLGAVTKNIDKRKLISVCFAMHFSKVN